MPTIVDFICPQCGCRFSAAFDGHEAFHNHCPYCDQLIDLDADPIDLAERFINLHFHPASEAPTTLWTRLCLAYHSSDTKYCRMIFLVFSTAFAAYMSIYPAGKEFMLFEIGILMLGMWIGELILSALGLVFTTADERMEFASAFVRAIERLKAMTSRR